MTNIHTTTSQQRFSVCTMGITAAVSLYAMLAMVVEPMQGSAASETDNIVVSAVIDSTLTTTCVDGAAPIGTLTPGTAASATENCYVASNNALGYSVAWRITTGTGAAGARFGTGHLANGDGDIFRALHVGGSNTGQTTKTIGSAVADGANDERWGGRIAVAQLSGAIVKKLDFGTDSDFTSKKFTNVYTGATVTLLTRPSESNASGDRIPFEFVAKIGTARFLPTGTYKATVIVTTSTN